MDELLSAGDVEVQAAVVGSYPKVLLFVLDDTACNIVAQRVLERDVLYVLEAVADGVVIIQSAEIRSQHMPPCESMKILRTERCDRLPLSTGLLL